LRDTPLLIAIATGAIYT
jgi:sec-independent protein translocase protein TatA